MEKRTHTRRDFLKLSAAVLSAGIVIPTIATDFWGNSILASGDFAPIAKGADVGSVTPAFNSDAQRANFVQSKNIDAPRAEASQDTQAAQSSQTPQAAEQPAQQSAPTYNQFQYDPWNLALANRWTPIPDVHTVSLSVVERGYKLDSRCVSDAAAMLAACRANGLSPVICSAYRSKELQTLLFRNAKAQRKAQGMSDADAYEDASRATAIPGTSEHQLGLALDIVDGSNSALNSSQEHTPANIWLAQNCWDFGFILRYASDKSHITGIIFEPWHYRYVGRDAAIAMRDSGLCLEEYLA